MMLSGLKHDDSPIYKMVPMGNYEGSDPDEFFTHGNWPNAIQDGTAKEEGKVTMTNHFRYAPVQDWVTED